MVSSMMKTLDHSDELLDLDGLMASLSTIPMTANSFRLFSAKLRTLLIEDTTSFKRSRCSVWDDFFAILFVYSFRFSSPSACWPRICRTLILQDSLDPMSVKGIVRNLIDRYFGIFTSVYANDVWNIEPFVLPWIDPATNLQNTLGFDTSFLHAVSIVPVGWGLLHHAAHASSQNMIAKLIDYGAEIGALDGDKRHPLHIAAASLNLDVSDYLSDNSRSSFIYDVDIYGKTPLDLLLQAASLSNWVDRVAPLRMFSSIIKLLGVSRNLWCYKGDSLIDSSNYEKSDKVDFTESIYSNKFYSILYHIRGCDDMVAVMIIELAKSCSSYLWNVPVIMQSIVLAVRQRRYRLLKNLLESFHEKLFTYFQYSSVYVSMGLNGMQAEGYFLQYCLAVAVQNKSSCRIISLLSHYVTLQFSGRDELQSHDSMPLTDVTNIAVMRCASLERTVLTAQESKAIFSPSNLEKIKKFAVSLEDDENDLRSNEEEIDVLESIIEINGISSVLHPCCMTESLRGPLGQETTALSRSAPLWSLFSDEENMSNKLSNISPLSLACLLGSSTILRTLLKNVPYSINLSTGPVPDLTDDISSRVSSPGGLGCNPVMYAVLSASPECLVILKEHMGEKLFSEACLQTDKCGNTPLHALLHFVKERALLSQRFHDRGLGPSSPSFPSHAFLTYDLKLEKIMQTLDVLLLSERGVAVQCVSEGRRADRGREAVLWGSRSVAIKERLVLINQRLTDLYDDIIQAPEPPSTPTRTPTSDVTPFVCHSCPSFPTIRINDENSILFLNKSMDNILDFNYENQVMKMLTKTERVGSNDSESLPSNVTKQRPTLSSLIESSEYLHAKKVVLESKEQWGQLQLQLGTPRGVKKFFLRIRSFLRAVVPDKFTSLLARCLVSLLENDKTVPHTGLPISGINSTRAQVGFNSNSSNSSSSSSGPNTQRYLTPPRRVVPKFTVDDQFFKSKNPSKSVPGPTCASDLSLSWKALAAVSGIRLRPGSFSRFDKTFQLFCKNLLALSSPLQSRVNNCADVMKNSDDMAQPVDDKKSSEGGGFTLSRGKWMEVRDMYVELKKIEKINSQKGLSTTSKFQWTVDLLIGYVQRVVRDGEVLYGTDNCRQKSSERRTSLMYIEMADLMYCQRNLEEILPQIRDIEDRLSVQTRTVNCDAMSSLLSHDPLPPPLKQLLLSYTDVIVEATASGAMSLSCSAASTAGCASHHVGGRRLTADTDALAVLDACVLKLALPSSPHSSSSIRYRPTHQCQDTTFTQDSPAMLSMTLFTLACAGQWEAATLTLKRLASSIMSDSRSMIQHSHCNPFTCCHLGVGNSPLEALRSCAASVTPFTSSSIYSPSGLFQPSLEGVGSDRKSDVLANYADYAAHNKLYGLCSLHYAAAEGQFQFIQTAIDLFRTAVVPIRLIADIMLLTKLNEGNKADKELPTALLTSLVSRADLDPRSVSLKDFLNIFVGEDESPLYRAALESIYAAASITANQKNPMNEDDLSVEGLMGVLYVPQYEGPLKGLCISTGPPHTPNTSSTSPQHVSNNDCEGYTNTTTPQGSECISQEQSAATYVCMMDGSSKPYQDFISDINNLNRALPVPQVALGVGHTGHTLLHEAARRDDPGLFNSIIKDLTCTHTAAAAQLNPRSKSAAHSSTGRDISTVKSIHSFGTAFTMNQDGATPVYLALLHGHVASVNDILTRCIERTSPTDHNNTSLRTDSAKYSTEVLSHGVDKIQTLDKRYQCGQMMERISYNDTLLSPIAPFGSCAVQKSNENTNTNIQSLFLNAACMRVERAERELMKITVDKTASQLMAASVDTLKMVLDRAVDIQKEISRTEFTVFTQLSYTPAGYVLDSLVRAKKILKLLSIPYSEIGSQSSTSSPENLNPKNTKNCIDSRNLNAAGVRGLLSLSVATEIKMLLAEWYAFRLESPGFDSFHSARRRCTDSASLSETLMLFHRLDLSAVSLGVVGGKAIGSKVRDIVKKVNSIVSGSPKDVPWWSGFSPARPRSDVHGNKHVKWEAQKVKNVTPQNLERMVDPPSESPHALPAYVSLEIRTRSQWNQSHSSSFFSFMSPYHSDIFALPPTQQSRDSYKSSIPSNLHAVEMEESARCKEMEDFMELWILDPRSVKEVLRLSYLVLEFARLLVVARGLVVMTSDTQQECVRTAECTGAGNVLTEHPLVRWQNELNAANIYKKEVLDFISNSAVPSSPPIQPSNPYMNNAVSAGATIPSRDSGWNPLGMRSKFLPLNRVSSFDLHGFLYPRNNVISQPAADRRDRILQCILLLLLSTRKEKMIESAIRIVRGFLPASSSLADGVKDRPKGIQNRATALLPTQPVRTQVAGNKNSITSTCREIERQKNDCYIVLEGLKELCVSDICHSNNGDAVFNPYSTEGYGQRNGVSTADRAYRKEREQEKEKYLVHFEKSCEILYGCYVSIVPEEEGVDCAGRSLIKEANKSVVQFKGDTDLRNDPQRTHHVAAALMDYLKCVRGVYRQRALYRIDVNSWMGDVKNNCNPLCALLSLPSTPVETKQARGTGHYTLGKAHSDEKKSEAEGRIECCRLLLSMGVSAFIPDKTGRIPLVTVALGGGDDRPSLLLEMLSYFSPDHHHHHLSNISNSNSNSNRNGSCATVAGVHDQNTNTSTAPVAMQRRRILEGDDFKYLVWHVLMGCPARDTSPSPIPCDVQNKERNGVQHGDCNGDRYKYMIGSKQTKSKMSIATRRLLNAEYASRNRVQVSILSILLDCGFPVCQPLGVYFSCLDLAALKMIPWGMLQIIEKMEFKIQDPPKKEITRIPLASIKSKPPSSTTNFNFNSSFSQSPPQYSVSSPFIIKSPLIPSTDLRSPSYSTTHAPFKAVHFMLLTLGLPPNNVLDYHNDKAKENSSSPLSFLTPLLDQTFNRLSVPGALPMTDLLPYTDIALDIHTHALYHAKHSTATSRFPGIIPTLMRPPAASVSSTASCVLPSSPVSLLSPDEDTSEYVVDAKNVLADCLESFFPTPRTKSIRVCNTPTPCPFWIAARTSIQALRETPLKSPLTDGPGRVPENAPIKDTSIFSHLDLDDGSENVIKKVPQYVTPISTWNVLHLAVRSGRVDVLRYLLNVPQVPGPKGVDDGYIGSVQQLLKGRKVAVNKPSLCLCACYYNQSTALDVLRSYQYFLSKGPSDGVGRDGFLALSSSPKKRRAVSLTRTPILHLSPAIEFKLSSKLHFEASNSDLTLLELSAYTGNEESFCYLLQSTDSKHTEEDILAVWATVTACIRRGCLSETCLLLAVTWVLERVTKAGRSSSDALNDSVHLDDFDDVIEVLKKESISSLACTLAVVTAPPADMMRYPNRYRNRNSVTGKNTVQSAESGVSARDSGRDDQESLGPFQETVLHLACRRGLLLLVRVMLQYGANPHVRDSTGLTPWETAVCAGHSDVTALIGEYIPANGRVHGAVRTITQAMRSYVKTKSENKNKIENKRIEVDARCMEDHP